MRHSKHGQTVCFLVIPSTSFGCVYLYLDQQSYGCGSVDIQGTGGSRIPMLNYGDYDWVMNE